MSNKRNTLIQLDLFTFDLKKKGERFAKKKRRLLNVNEKDPVSNPVFF